MAGLALLAIAAGALWDYRMQGELDGASLACTGRARMSIAADRIGWMTERLHCTGAGKADWLHDGSHAAALVKIDGAWSVDGGLPGAAVCRITDPADQSIPVRALTIDCDLICRSATAPCYGEAHYAFFAVRRWRNPSRKH